jgi:hypothetical protein
MGAKYAVNLVCRNTYFTGSQAFLDFRFSTSSPNIDVASQNFIIGKEETQY